MKNWYWFSLATMVCWGAWGIFGKLASAQINSKLLVLVSITTSFLLLWILFLVTGFEVEKNLRGIGFAVLAGVAGSIGSIFFYLALRSPVFGICPTGKGKRPLLFKEWPENPAPGVENSTGRNCMRRN
jgi:uncharacterized membrane protein